MTYDDIPGEEDGDGSSFYGTPPYHQKSAQTNLPHVEMVRPAQTDSSLQEAAKEEEAKQKPAKKPELTEEQKRHIIMSENFRKFLDRSTRITERALFYNEPADIFIDYTGTREKLERFSKITIYIYINIYF